jgi:RimJ/RimL family protein N-acetyltransferase
VNLQIRKAEASDLAAIWSIFHPVVAAGETYAYDPETTREQAREIWMEAPAVTFVAEQAGTVVGTYYIKANQPGLGSHVCNCGYMVAESARGRGVASRMCEHSQREALSMGFKAMQFNLVVATNEGAIRLWRRLGFAIVGTLSRAFRHRRHGFVDALVMYKWLREK